MANPIDGRRGRQIHYPHLDGDRPEDMIDYGLTPEESREALDRLFEMFRQKRRQEPSQLPLRSEPNREDRL